MNIVDNKLAHANITKLATVVESAYKSSFIDHYSSFHFVDSFLVDRRWIQRMYVLMTRMSPFVHAVLSATVLHP
jgi:hypothetical protein